MLGLLDAVKIGAGAIVGGFLAYLVGHWTGSAAGRADLQSEIATAAAKAEKERVSDDATLSRLPDYDLCVRALRSRGMPLDACDELRRLPAE